MVQDRFVFTPKFSLRPDKLVLYNDVFKRPAPIENKHFAPHQNSIKYDASQLELFDFKIRDGVTYIDKSNIEAVEVEKKVLEKKFHNFQISVNAQRNLQQKITWLYHLAKGRAIKTYSGKQLLNFKMNFMTLTLPSKQVHNTATITNECFNQFLTEIKQRTGCANYVWRLEFQANGNAHYHIATDTYLDYFLIQKIWNRIISKLGYVQAYQSKMLSMSLHEYAQAYSKYGKVDFKTLAQRYAKGKADNWQNPPSVDVINVTSDKKIRSYMAKYFGKNGKSGAICNELDNEGNSFGLRLWFCSRSLSKLDAIIDFVQASAIQFEHILQVEEGVNTVYHDYCKIMYFDIRVLSPVIKGLFYKLFVDYAISTGYRRAS